jgi:pimeloyl-ACP methyl ester carboxylesterase
LINVEYLMTQPNVTTIPSEVEIYPPIAGVTHRLVNIGGLRLHVAELGQGEPLVLLHGWPQHWGMWRLLLPQLAERFRVVCPDLRGFGWSDAPSKGYEKERLTTDLLTLFDALGLERVRLMGHDWGGWVGFLLCLRQPTRIQQFVALNIPHPWQRLDWPLLTAMWRFWYQWVIASPIVGSWLLRRQPGFVRSVILRRSLVRKQAFSDEELMRYAARLQQPARSRASVQLYRSFLLREFIPLISGRYRSAWLRVPTLVLYGARDIFVSARLLRGPQALPELLTVELAPQSGHFIVQEYPELVLERARAFFTQQPEQA